MSHTFLNVPIQEKDAAKALGARWDPLLRKWYVLDGRDLAPFQAWLPAGAVAPGQLSLGNPVDTQPKALAITTKGISLSSLLSGVAALVAQAYKTGAWVMVEVTNVHAKGGHVYLEISERDRTGTVLAQARATIWARTANTIIPTFEAATGAQLAAGIKLLVRCKPVFNAQYGFSIDIDAIDSEYTLGDLEAKKKEIRARSIAEGVFASKSQALMREVAGQGPEKTLSRGFALCALSSRMAH